MDPKQSWHQRHVDLYELMIVTFIAIVLIIGFLSYKYLRVEESSSSAHEEKTPVSTAAKDRYTATPLPNTNPFSEPHANPFE